MGRTYIFAAVLFCMQSPSKASRRYGWCSPYDTFCLFSEGIETRASDLSEAQFKCSETKDDSWPVELGDERVKKVFIEFIHNYSISNVILNALNQNGTWYWKSSNTRVKNVFNVKDNIMFYNNPGFYSDYSVVCMTDCWANWNEINQTQMLSSNSYNNLSINTPEECKEICEKNFACSSVDWTYVTLFHGCWIHKYPYDASKLSSSDTICHHVIDRTIKSTDSCIGGVFLASNDLKPSQSSYESTNVIVIVIVIPIIAIIGFVVIIIAIVVLCKRRSKATENVAGKDTEKTKIDSSTSNPAPVDEETTKPAPQIHYEILNNGTSDINLYTHLSLQPNH